MNNNFYIPFNHANNLPDFMEQWQVMLANAAMSKIKPVPVENHRPDKIRATEQGIPKAFRQYATRHGQRL